MNHIATLVAKVLAVVPTPFVTMDQAVAADRIGYACLDVAETAEEFAVATRLRDRVAFVLTDGESLVLRSELAADLTAAESLVARAAAAGRDGMPYSVDVPGRPYKMVVSGGRPVSCSCDGWTKRFKPCKHMKAATPAFAQAPLVSPLPPPPRASEVVTERPVPPKYETFPVVVEDEENGGTRTVHVGSDDLTAEDVAALPPAARALALRETLRGLDATRTVFVDAKKPHAECAAQGCAFCRQDGYVWDDAYELDAEGRLVARAGGAPKHPPSDGDTGAVELDGVRFIGRWEGGSVELVSVERPSADSDAECTREQALAALAKIKVLILSRTEEEFCQPVPWRNALATEVLCTGLRGGPASKADGRKRSEEIDGRQSRREAELRVLLADPKYAKAS